MENLREEKNPYIISYLLLRKLIGFIGILLPVVLVIGSFLSNKYTTPQPSISDYYFTNMGDVFVGNLCAVSLFLFCYKGYDYRDNITANLAAVFAVFVALFPTKTDLDREHLSIIDSEEVANYIHFIAATLFFSCLAFFSLYLFRLPRENKLFTARKRTRNKVYFTCGVIIIVCILLIGLFLKVKYIEAMFEPYYPVIMLETIALWAFGFSWLVKGETILKDRDKE